MNGYHEKDLAQKLDKKKISLKCDDGTPRYEENYLFTLQLTLQRHPIAFSFVRLDLTTLAVNSE